MSPLPPLDGPRVMTLLDGRLAFDDSEEYAHECEARWIAAMKQADREARLYDLERIRGVEATDRLRKTIEEVIAVEAARVV